MMLQRFVILIALHQSAQWRAGDDAEVAVEGVFVFLIGDERINFTATDQRDVPGLGAAQIFLQKNTLGIIHVAQPRARVAHGFAQNRVNRTGRRAERIFDDERTRMLRENFFRERNQRLATCRVRRQAATNAPAACLTKPESAQQRLAKARRF